jgi:hypothetical protein
VQDLAVDSLDLDDLLQHNALPYLFDVLEPLLSQGSEHFEHPHHLHPELELAVVVLDSAGHLHAVVLALLHLVLEDVQASLLNQDALLAEEQVFVLLALGGVVDNQFPAERDVLLLCLVLERVLQALEVQNLSELADEVPVVPPEDEAQLPNPDRVENPQVPHVGQGKTLHEVVRLLLAVRLYAPHEMAVAGVQLFDQLVHLVQKFS